MNGDRLAAVPHDRIAAFLDHRISVELVERLAQVPRLRTRLADLMTSRLGTLGPLDLVQAKLLAMDQQEMAQLTMKAGVVWHAGSIAHIIDGNARSVIITSLGEEYYKLALATATKQPVTAPLAASPEVIARAVGEDGAACLAAWCAHQPSAVRGRLDLMRPPALPGPVHIAAGPRIIEELLTK
jgi:hypothetical protein